MPLFEYRIHVLNAKGGTLQNFVTPAKNKSGARGNRRAFLHRFGVALASGVVAESLANFTHGKERVSRDIARRRMEDCFDLRRGAASATRQAALPLLVTNGDEERYSSFIGNYSKGLPHDSIGEVTPDAYRTLIEAANSGTPKAYEKVPLRGALKLVNPLAGVAFDLEGIDSHQVTIEAPLTVASCARADDAIESYWMALCRDVGFSDYDKSPLTQAAASELSRLVEFVGPKSKDKVTPRTLFRGFTPDDLAGPFVSQFLLKPFTFGNIPIPGQIITSMSGVDHLTDPSEWLNVRNGHPPTATSQNDPLVRYIRNGRDLAAYVSMDHVFQAGYNAGIWLFTHAAPPNPGNPYLSLTKQSPFATFGLLHFLSLLGEATTRAMKAVWFAKWFVHRTLRPEEYGGLVHMTATHKADYSIHKDILESVALKSTYSKNGSYLLPQVYPEGCPAHPSYASGHATTAGACATILKAAFNCDTQFESLPGGQIQIARGDGLALVPYTGADSGQITVGGEINKLAANIGIARNMAGIHWRTDYSEGVKLGEAVALSILREQRGLYSEDFSGFKITKFNGETVTV